jgi:transcriptional regulator with XRE-family HTH domain
MFMATKKNSLAQFLKAKRNISGLSQTQVAEELGYKTPQFISNWERGLSSPPISAIKKIAQMYSISPEELFELVLESAIESAKADLASKFKKV